MRVVSALDVRKRFGQIIDEAAAGERLVIERAGQPVAAIVPLSDLEAVDPELRRQARLRAVDDLQRLALRSPYPRTSNTVEVVRRSRAERDAQIAAALERATE